MSRLIRLALVIFAMIAWTGNSFAQEAPAEGATEEASPSEDLDMDDELEDLEPEELDDPEEVPEAAAEAAENPGAEGFMDDAPTLDVTPTPESPLNALLAELATPSTLGALAAIIFLLILLPLTNALRGQR